MTEKLSDLSEFIIDTKHATPKYSDRGYPCIRTPNIGPGYFILDNVKFVNKETYEEWTQRATPKAGDLILAREAPVGNVAWIPHGLRPCIGQRTVLIRPKNEFVDSRYLAYLLLGDECQNRMHSMSGGATVAHLNMKDIRNLELPTIPPLPIQRKIASILSAYDDLIENNLRRIKILEEMAQNLYREWFVKFRFPGHEKVRFVDSELGKIPEGWELRKLSNITSTQYGYTASATDTEVGPKYLRGMDINKTSYIDWNTVPYCQILDSKRDKFRLFKGDILIIRMADPGKVGIVERIVDAVFASYLVRVTLLSNIITPYYLFYFMVGDRYQGYITGASTGTTRKSASSSVLTDIDILIPASSLLAIFEEKIQSFRSYINNILARNTILRQTRDLLLPKLISGELDVSELDINLPEETET